MKRAATILLLSASALFSMTAPPHRPPAPSAPAAPVAVLTERPLPADPRPFVVAPTGGGLSVDGTDGALTADSTLSISFPTDMVPADRIDADGSESPVVIWPDLDAHFIWRTASQGNLQIQGPIIPSQTYRFRLRLGLKDLAGKPLDPQIWGVSATSSTLDITQEDYDERDHLNSRPQINLQFNYPVRLTDAASGIWIQDRASRQKFPVELLLNRAEGQKDTGVVDVRENPSAKVDSFLVTPTAPLPMGHHYDLIVEGVKDAYGGRGLSYPRVYPLGTTRPLSVEYVVGRNFPLDHPRIEIKFGQALDDEALPDNAVSIAPAVSNLAITKEGETLNLQGDFDPHVHYAVTLNQSIKSVSGYGLAASEKWTISFHPKQSAILFPNQHIRERSLLGLIFSFYQVNTSSLTWKLAPIPLAQLPTMLKREQEFTTTRTDENGNAIMDEEGIFQNTPSAPLIGPGLEPVASGSIPASADDAEVLRNISWKPADTSNLEGPMLLEVTGTDSKRRMIGNRAVIYFGEAAITQKKTADQTIVRVARLTDGEPVAGIALTALDDQLREISTGTTDGQGMVTWKQTDIPNYSYFWARGTGLSTLQPAALADSFSSGSPSNTPPPALRSYTLTDRSLYRPGQSVQFKGFVRQEAGGLLKVQPGQAVKWSIEKADGDEVVAEGQAKVDAAGSWNAGWLPPAEIAPGGMRIKVLVGGEPAGEPAEFRIEEFRTPAFSVLCEEEKLTQPAESVISVQSQYFHGAPNVGSRVQWTASWESDSSDGFYSSIDADDPMTRVDLYSEKAPHPTYEMDATGETALDANGRAILHCPAPFTDPGNRAHCHVYWKVDVTGPDGQTITGGVTQIVPMAAVLLGVKSEPVEKKTLAFTWDAKPIFAPAPTTADAKLYEVVTKSVKERIAPDVYRYRNFDQYNVVDQRTGVKDARLEFQPANPGRYVLVLSPPSGVPGFPVSEQAYLPGDEESQVPVQSDSSATVFSVWVNRTKTAAWKVGEKAQVDVLSASGGIAWVTVETDKILDTFTMPIHGNTSRIEIPVKPEYEPNVFVTVYLLHPGGTGQSAGEMFGYTRLSVVAPDRNLGVTVHTDHAEYEPREKVSGEVQVTANGRSVAGADLAIYTVDDSILTLGDWQLPSLFESFFPERSFGVTTCSALRGYVDKIQPSWLTMKGFVAGDGGPETYENTAFARKEFKPLILWQPNVKTDARGIAKFACDAPDNLTRFRVIAVGETKQSQFGAGDATFNVSKKVMIEPSLPRFLRDGDEVELRAVARQKIAPQEKLLVRCSTTGNLALTGDVQQEITADRDAPVVVSFKARATGIGTAAVKFDIVDSSNSKLGDAVQISLPVTYPVILKKDSVGGALHQTTFAPAKVAPSSWSSSQGSFSLGLSTTPWLPKLMGLPYLLEYPHGCFEQKSSKLLAYTYLGGLLDYLPDAGLRKKNYQHIVDEILEEMEAGLLDDGRLPYWPGGTVTNDFVTIQSAWCVSEAENAGFEVPERLATNFPDVLQKMVTRTGGLRVSPSEQAFALFVLSSFGNETTKEVAQAADEIYLQRDKLDSEGRAFLAVALHRLNLAPAKQLQLVAELPRKFSDYSFDRSTFSSVVREEALCTWARILITPGQGTEELQRVLEKMMLSSAALSTQENLWLLVAFDALLKSAPLASLSGNSVRPKPPSVAANGSAVGWGNQDMARLANFVVTGLPKANGSFVVRAEYRTNERMTPFVTQGMKIERVVKDLTDPRRVGTAEAPYKIGDQLLISYRFSSDKAQSYVAVEDLLPAGLEVVNPNLALFGKYYSVPSTNGVNVAELSHSELRDQQTNLYFDDLPVGPQSYSVLARATAAGDFIWPATQISPMYDSRFFGRSASSTCIISGK